MTSDYAGAPNDVDSGNWIQTVLDTGWSAVLRCYSPKPSFLDELAAGRDRAN